jgi:hypothetical protein
MTDIFLMISSITMSDRNFCIEKKPANGFSFVAKKYSSGNKLL